MIGLAGLWLARKPHVRVSPYTLGRIEKGMTVPEVESILGHPAGNYSRLPDDDLSLVAPTAWQVEQKLLTRGAVTYRDWVFEGSLEPEEPNEFNYYHLRLWLTAEEHVSHVELGGGTCVIPTLRERLEPWVNRARGSLGF
jgi:hypothetical protein